MFSRLKIILILLNIFFNFLIKSNFFCIKSNFLKQRQLVFYNYKYFTIFKFFETFYKKTFTKTFFPSNNFKLNNFKWFFLKFYFLSYINFYNIFFKRFFFNFKNNFYKSYNNRLFLNLLFLKNFNHSSFLNKLFTSNLKNTVKLKKQLRAARLSNKLYILKKKKFYNRRTLYTKELIKEYRLLKNQKCKKSLLSKIIKRLYVKRRRRQYISKKRKRKIKRRNRYLKNLNYFFKWSFALKNFFNFKLRYTYNFLFMYIFLKIKKRKLKKSLDFFKHFLVAKNYLKKRYKDKKYYCLLKKTRSNSFLTVINNFGDVIFYFSSGRLNLVTKKYKRSFAAIKLFWPLLVKRLKMLSIKNIIFLLDPGFRRSLYYISRLFGEHRLNLTYTPKSIKPHNNILNTKKLRRVKRK